ncbi:MAG: superoxide dismutase family protein [Clostridia bacterium]|nr:superoxide dismutase family protein [Clostridia bacterium]
MNRSPSRPDAVAYISGGHDAPHLFGEVRFYQNPTNVLITADISNLPKNSETGFFAFHIHEGESCGGDDFANTGSHYNPNMTPHPNHAGDLPPLLFCNGGAYLSVKTDRFRVADIIGRTVVIHSDADDFVSQPAGNAGKKIACGVIRRM